MTMYKLSINTSNSIGLCLAHLFSIGNRHALFDFLRLFDLSMTHANSYVLTRRWMGYRLDVYL